MKKRKTKARKRSLGWRLVTWGTAGAVALFLWAALARHFAPAANTGLNRFDTVAPRLIMTGGTNPQGFNEARAMARTAEAQGVPASAILIEPNATDTIQNACYSVRIMKTRGWHSAEVVSTPSHLARAALIFRHMPIEWRMHAAPLLEPESNRRANRLAALETLKTAYYLVWSNWAKRCQP